MDESKDYFRTILLGFFLPLRTRTITMMHMIARSTMLLMTPLQVATAITVTPPPAISAIMMIKLRPSPSVKENKMTIRSIVIAIGKLTFHVCVRYFNGMLVVVKLVCTLLVNVKKQGVILTRWVSQPFFGRHTVGVCRSLAYCPL